MYDYKIWKVCTEAVASASDSYLTEETTGHFGTSIHGVMLNCDNEDKITIGLCSHKMNLK